MEEPNDKKDAFILHPDKIRRANHDAYVRCIAAPFKKKVEARAEKVSLNLHAVACGVWQRNLPTSDPGQEYAEFTMGCLNRLIDNHHITAAYWTVHNEPNKGSEGQGLVIRAMKKLVAGMRGAASPSVVDSGSHKLLKGLYKVGLLP